MVKNQVFYGYNHKYRLQFKVFKTITRKTFTDDCFKEIRALVVPMALGFIFNEMFYIIFYNSIFSTFFYWNIISILNI